METEKYGKYYWCVKTSLSKDGEIYLMADRVEITPDGSLVFWREKEDLQTAFINLAITSGEWKAVYAASTLDGAPVAVEHWQNKSHQPDNTKAEVIIEDKIIRMIDLKGPLTLREITQYVHGVDSAQARAFVAALVSVGKLQQANDGRTVRYSLAE